MSIKPQSEGRFPMFDVLRLALAAVVVVSHTVWRHQLLPAVPGFLAISGYLVLESYLKTGSWGRFLWKRACRVLPGFLASLALMFALFGLGGLWNSAFFYATLGLSQVPSPAPTNGALWSLGWEELFYFLLAVLCWAGAYKAKWPIWLLGILSLPLVFWGWYNFPGAYQKAAVCLPIAFFIGNLIYLYRDGFRRISAWWALPMLVLSSVTELNGLRPIATVLVSVAVLLVGLNYRPQIRPFPDFSYGAYVYHYPLSVRFGKGFEWLSILVLVCVASWYIIEKPVLLLKNWGRKQSESEKSPMELESSPAAS